LAYALATYNDGVADRKISQMHYNDGSQVRDVLIAHYNNGAGDQEVFRKVWHRSNMTRGSVSGGTTTITTSRGFSDGTYAVSAIGTKTDIFAGEGCSVLCRRLATGAAPKREITLYVTGATTQIGGPQSTVRVSVDGGANWTTLTWITNDSEWGISGYFVDGDPLGFNSMTNGQAFEAIIQYV
jgi:hypothetical protein